MPHEPQTGVSDDPAAAGVASRRVRQPSRPARGFARILLAAVLLALAWQIGATASAWVRPAGDGPLRDLRPLIYFTLHANLIAGVTLVLFAVVLLARIAPPAWMEYVRGLATVALLVTATVNVVALGGSGDVSFHVVVPLLMIAWWVLMPPLTRLPWWAALVWLGYPVAWVGLVYAVRAGRADHWVPYYFLDPAQVGGWGGAATYVGLVLAVFLAFGLLAVLISRVARWAPAAWALFGVRV